MKQYPHDGINPHMLRVRTLRLRTRTRHLKVWIRLGFQNNKRQLCQHRIDGPASIVHLGPGGGVEREWYHNGKLCEK
jgi:hypothetical protein